MQEGRGTQNSLGPLAYPHTHNPHSPTPENTKTHPLPTFLETPTHNVTIHENVTRGAYRRP